MSFCQCSSKLCSISTFFGSSQRVARSGEKRPCKREIALFFFTQDVFAKRTILKRKIEQRAIRATLILLSCCLACSARPARPARPAHDTPDIRALPALFPASLITRPAACGVHCMPSYALCPQPGTENTKYAEKRHEVAKCQRFGAVNRP